MNQAKIVITFWLVFTAVLLGDTLSAEVRSEKLSKSTDLNFTATSTPDTRISNVSNDVAVRNISRPAKRFNRWYCFLGPRPHRNFRERCCAYEANAFRLAWSHGGYYLTSLLEKLQRWNCKQFVAECARPSYNFTPFNNIVYQRFCHPSKMQDKCYDKIIKVNEKYGFLGNKTDWKQLIDDINPETMSTDDLTEPCVAIALFDRSSGGVGRFHEIVEPYFPFCGLQWSGYDIDTTMKTGVSVWTGLASGCKGAIIFFMVFMVLLGLITIGANLIILFVFGKNNKIRNSQAIFQMSLAIADLLVGLMVWPNMVYMQVVIFMNPRKMGNILTEERLTRGNRTAFFPNFGTNDLERRFPSSGLTSQFNHSYIMYMGFLTLLSIMVSVLTLMAATFDRLFAIVFPLRYRKRNPKRFAASVCVLVWIICFMFCLLPVILPELEFDRLSSIFISASGDYGTIVALAALVGPLVVTWIISIITFEVSRRHGIRTKAIFATARVQASNTEKRLAKTLCLMVGIFTLSVFPAIACLAVGSYFIRDIWQHPESLDTKSANAYASVEYISVVVLTANSLWNCFIYSIRNPGFRKATNDIFSKSISRHGSTEGTQRNLSTLTYLSKKLSGSSKKVGN